MDDRLIVEKKINRFGGVGVDFSLEKAVLLF